MKLNQDQEAAVQACGQRIADGEPVTRLFGYAGTGKTTIVPDIVAESGISAGRVIYAAPTGKAAAVLTRKGCPAKTIHSLLYHPPEEEKHAPPDDQVWPEHVVSKCSVSVCGKKPRERQFKWTLDEAKTYLASRASLIVLDEVSMVGSQLGTDIVSLGIPVLAVGDPAQLQPVRDRQFFMDREPDALLTRIERNSGSVLRLAQDIRLHGLSAVSRYPDINLGTVGQSVAVGFSQIIVGKNRTRDEKNAKVRALLGYSGPVPSVGERIICLRNNYRMRCLNGQQFVVQESFGTSDPDVFRARLECDCGSPWEMDRCMTCGWDRGKDVPVWAGGFAGWAGESSLADMPYQIGGKAMMATFGYCITAHKSQGSEWSSVLVVNEAWGKERVNWLYTAVTRAQDSVAIIRLWAGKR